jgi:myo-inositol-1(or 4)-monophosphatase
MPPDETAARLEFTKQTARAAGALLKAKLGTHIGVRFKDVRRNLVTEADTESEALIKAAIGSSYPHDAILGEESGESGEPGRGRWIVDPLDGTTNYAHGYRFFSVSIAYELDGIVRLGVVHDPIADELYHAVRGDGAECNGTRLHVSDAVELIESLLVTGFPAYRVEEPLKNLEPFRDFMLLAQAIRRDGSAALDLCYVAAGRFEGFWESGLHAWDVAAGSLILEEAGGRISDYRGEKMELDSGQLLATNGHIHDAMVNTLRAYAT